VPSEWPEARVHYTPEDLQAFAAEVRSKGLSKARPPLPKALPKEANPLERLNHAESAKEPAEEIGTSPWPWIILVWISAFVV
jgi:hypothetical protein